MKGICLVIGIVILLDLFKRNWVPWLHIIFLKTLIMNLKNFDNEWEFDAIYDTCTTLIIYSIRICNFLLRIAPPILDVWCYTNISHIPSLDYCSDFCHEQHLQQNWAKLTSFKILFLQNMLCNVLQKILSKHLYQQL
jgi:hypothetical protein